VRVPSALSPSSYWNTVPDIKRFSIPYSLKPIPEVQEYLHACFEQSQGKSDLQDLYRRRCVIAFGRVTYLP
jgi:hypothetical protein